MYERLNRALVLLFVFGGVFLAFSQTFTIEDVLPGTKGNPILVQTYEAAVSMAFGDPVTKPKVPVWTYRFTPKGQLLESVQFEDGNPVSYFRATYDAAGRTLAVLNRDASGETTTTYSYGQAPGTYSTATRDSKGAILSGSSTTTTKSTTQTSILSRHFDDRNALLDAEREVKDSKGKTVQRIGYNATGEVSFLFTISQSANERISTYYSGKGELFSRTTEKLDSSDNPVSIASEWPGLSSSSLSKNTIKIEYKYDKVGNWVESVEYEMSDKFGGLLPNPVRRMYRDITYPIAGTTASAMIEPKTLYPRATASPQAETDKPSEAPTASLKMTVFEEKDPFDDLRTVTFVVDADSGKGTYGENVSLVIRAKESHSPELYINWQSYLGDEVYVTMRVDADAPDNAQWQISTDKKASFYAGDVAELLRRLLLGKKIVAKTTPYNESPITVEFDISEFAKLIEPYPWIFSQQ